MADERWKRLKRFVAAAQELEPEEQAAFLNGLGDPDLCKEVQSLLAADGEKFLEQPPPGVDSIVIDSATPFQTMDRAQVPDRIGPYRMLREIGEGGMGVVYEAEQEKPVRRKVALKLIKWGMDTKQVIARFESERLACSRASGGEGGL